MDPIERAIAEHDARTGRDKQRELLGWESRDRELIRVMFRLLDNDYQPYVVWTARKDTPWETFWGHYYRELSDAEDDLSGNIRDSRGD